MASTAALQTLIANYRKWQNANGSGWHQAVDPLVAAGMKNEVSGANGLTGQYASAQGVQAQGQGVDAAPLVNAFKQGGVTVNQSAGPRQGQALQAFSLGDGRVAHVYYDANGKRQVQVFHSTHTPAG